MTEPTDTTEPEAATSPAPGQVVMRTYPMAVRARAGRIERLRTRLPELAQRPVVVAAATVGATVAVNLLRQAARGGSPLLGRGPTAVTVTGHIVHHVRVIQEVHVVRHVVHHVSQPGSQLTPR